MLIFLRYLTIRKKQMKPQLFETIRFENGRFYNLERHTARMNRARQALFGRDDRIDLEDVLKASVTTEFQDNPPKDLLFKCRVLYTGEIETIEFVPYQKPVICSLKIVVDNNINYSFKYLDRSQLEQLYNQRGKCSDILIVKNGLITDTYFANILFFNGKNWVTPTHPLLKGTQRQYLLETGQVIPADIRISDLKHFQKARLVNAMIRLEDEVEVDVAQIRL